MSTAGAEGRWSSKVEAVVEVIVERCECAGMARYGVHVQVGVEA